MRPEDRIPRILDRLYAGTLDEQQWRGALTDITDLVGGAGCVLFATDPVKRAIVRDEAVRIDPAAAAAYRQHWIAKEVRLEPLLDVPVGAPAFDAMLLPMKTWRGSEIYNDFLRKTDTPWLLSFWLHKQPSRVAALSIEGSGRRGPFGAADGALVAPLIPHLTRALHIKDRLERSRVAEAIDTRRLDRLSCGVIVLDQGGHIVEANAVAEDLLRKRSGLRAAEGRVLRLNEPACSELKRWLAAGQPPPGNANGLLHVPRTVGRPLSVLASRLPEGRASWVSADAFWLLLVFDSERRLQASTQVIAQDLGLSAREAEITAMLVVGYEVPEIAVRLRISSHTIRNHLKSVYSKTDTRSQAEIVRLVANGPAMAVP